MKASKRIVYDGKNNVVLNGLSIIAGDRPAIEISNCTNLRISGCNLSNGTGVEALGIKLFRCINVTIEDCYLTNLSSGVLASTSTRVYINGNKMLNMQGPMPRGQFVQFIDCYGSGNKIMNNRLENTLGKSRPEDAISIYQSDGTPDSPITVQGNWIRGGGPSKTGGGICLGDGGGGWQVASDNILVNPGQYGIGIASGQNMSILRNKVFASQSEFTNVGILAWNQYLKPCGNINIDGNEVNWTASAGYKNPFWNGNNCGLIAGNNNNWDSDITVDVLPLKMF